VILVEFGHGLNGLEVHVPMELIQAPQEDGVLSPIIKSAAISTPGSDIPAAFRTSFVEMFRAPRRL